MDTNRGTAGAGGESGALRVLDITKFYAAASGGVRTYLNAKIGDFAARQVAHSLVVPGEREEVEVRGRTRVYSVPGPRIPITKGYRLLTNGAAIRRIVERERPQVIEVGSPFLVPILVRRAIAGSGIRTVGFYHSDLIRTYAEPYLPYRLAAPVRVLTRNLARRYIRDLYRGFDATVAASPSVVGELRSLGVPNVHHVPLGVDLDVFSSASRDPAWLRSRAGVEADVPIALYMGRFCPEKRLDIVLEAHRRLRGPARPHLVLVGEGPQRPALEEAARTDPRLTVLPYVSDRTELARIYAGADLYVAPGPGETFGLAIVEAMASGLPVVAVERGAAPDRLEGSGCGFLYRDGSVDSCIAALERARAALSPGLRTAARAHAERNFGWNRTFEALIALYRELIAAQ